MQPRDVLICRDFDNGLTSSFPKAHYAAHAGGRRTFKKVVQAAVFKKKVSNNASIERAKGEMMVLHEILFNKKEKEGEWLKKRW